MISNGSDSNQSWLIRINHYTIFHLFAWTMTNYYQSLWAITNQPSSKHSWTRSEGFAGPGSAGMSKHIKTFWVAHLHLLSRVRFSPSFTQSLGHYKINGAISHLLLLADKEFYVKLDLCLVTAVSCRNIHNLGGLACTIPATGGMGVAAGCMYSHGCVQCHLDRVVASVQRSIPLEYGNYIYNICII